MSVQTSGSRLGDAMLRSVVWGFVGGLFGVLFIVAHDAMAPRLPFLDPLLLAAATAGAVGAVVYSSMRLTLLAAGACALMFALVELASVAVRARVGEFWVPELLLGGAVVIGGLASSSSGTQNSPTLARTAALASSTSANIRAQAPAASNVRRMLL